MSEAEMTFQMQTIEEALEAVDHWFGKLPARQRFDEAWRSMRIVNNAAKTEREGRALNADRGLSVDDWVEVITDASRSLISRRTTRHNQLRIIELYRKMGKTPALTEQAIEGMESSVKILAGMMRIERLMLGKQPDPKVVYKRIAIDELRHYIRDSRWLLAIWLKLEQDTEEAKDQ